MGKLNRIQSLLDLWEQTVPNFTVGKKHRHSSAPGMVLSLVLALALGIYSVGRILQITDGEVLTFASQDVINGFFDPEHVITPGKLAFGL